MSALLCERHGERVYARASEGGRGRGGGGSEEEKGRESKGEGERERKRETAGTTTATIRLSGLRLLKGLTLKPCARKVRRQHRGIRASKLHLN
jgi:hypothetical protein